MEKKSNSSKPKPKYVYLDKFERRTNDLYRIIAENHMLTRTLIDRAERKITYLRIGILLLTGIVLVLAYMTLI